MAREICEMTAKRIRAIVKESLETSPDGKISQKAEASARFSAQACHEMHKDGTPFSPYGGKAGGT